MIISEREKERGIESTICYRIFSLSLSSCERDISAWACVFGKLCEGVSVYFAKFLWRQHEILHGTSVDSFHTHYNFLSHTLTFISLSISSLSVFHMLVSLSVFFASFSFMFPTHMFSVLAVTLHLRCSLPVNLEVFSYLNLHFISTSVSNLHFSLYIFAKLLWLYIPPSLA